MIVSSLTSSSLTPASSKGPIGNYIPIIKNSFIWSNTEQKSQFNIRGFSVQKLSSSHTPVQVKEEQRGRDSQDVWTQYHVICIWPVFTRNTLSCGSWADKRSSWSRENMIGNVCGNLPLVWLGFFLWYEDVISWPLSYIYKDGRSFLPVWHHIFKNKALMQVWVCEEKRNTE